MYWFHHELLHQYANQIEPSKKSRLRTCVHSAYNRKELVAFLSLLVMDPAQLKALPVVQLRLLAIQALDEIEAEMGDSDVLF